jgi:hypothetical protein
LRAEANVRGTVPDEDRLEAAREIDARRLGEGREIGPQEATEAVLAAFPGSTVLEDWQQVGHDQWVDRRTGLLTDQRPAGAVPLISG